MDNRYLPAEDELWHTLHSAPSSRVVWVRTAAGVIAAYQTRLNPLEPLFWQATDGEIIHPDAWQARLAKPIKLGNH